MAVIRNFLLEEFSVLHLFSYVVNNLGDVVSNSEKFNLISTDGFSFSLRGKNFEYNNQNDLIDGTIKTVDFFFEDQTLATMTDISLDAAKFYDALDAIYRKGDGRDLEKILGNLSYDYSGSPYNDLFLGGRRDDKIDGNAGNDVLAGERGDDEIEGGKGDDTFLYNAPWDDDTILDFRSGQDEVDLSGVKGLKSFDQIEQRDNRDGNAVATFKDSSIVFDGLKWKDLDEGDFIF